MEASPEKKVLSGTFGPKLRQERQRHHLSQEKLAEMVGCDVRSIRRWEQGKSIPDYENRHRLSKALDITLENFHQLLQPVEEKGEELLETSTVVLEEYPRLLLLSDEKSEEPLESDIQAAEFLPNTNHSTYIESKRVLKHLTQPQERRTLLKWGGIGLAATLTGGSGLFYWFTRSSRSSAGSQALPLASPPVPPGQMYIYNAPPGVSMYSVEWSPHYDFIVCVDANNRAQLITVADANPSQTGSTSSVTRYDSSGKASSAVNCITWSPDGMHLASPSMNDNVIHIWDPVDIVDTHFAYTFGVPESIAWSHDGNTIAISDIDGMISTWDAKTHQLLQTYTGHKGVVRRVAWSTDSTYLASAGADGTVRIWNTTKEEEPLIYRGHQQEVLDVKWSPLADARIISASADKTVQIWNPLTKQTERIYTQHKQPVQAAEWSSDGRLIASAGVDTTIQVWDAATGAPYGTYKGHTSTVLSLSWSPNGMNLASASVDGSMRIWHITL